MQTRTLIPVVVKATKDFRVGPRPGNLVVREGDTREIFPDELGRFTTQTNQGHWFGVCRIGSGWEEVGSAG
jgi:hypothetical protein